MSPNRLFNGGCLRIPAPGRRVVGRVQRAIRRGLQACGELVTGELLEWAYEHPRPWQRRWVRRAAHKVAVVVGKRKGEAIWRLKDEG